MDSSLLALKAIIVFALLKSAFVGIFPLVFAKDLSHIDDFVFRKPLY